MTAKEEFNGLWPQKLNLTSGRSDWKGDDSLSPRHSEPVLLRLQTQLSCNSQSGDAEPAGGAGNQHPPGLSLGNFGRPPRRTSSLPTPNQSEWVAALQSQQAFQLGGYYGKAPYGRDMISAATSGQVSSLTDLQSPPSPMPALGSPMGVQKGPGGTSTHHSSRLQPTLSLRSQPEEEEEHTADLASMLRLSQATPQEVSQKEAGDEMSRLAAGLLRHHSAPSSVFGNLWKTGGSSGRSSSGLRPPSHGYGAGLAPGLGLGPLSAVTSADEPSPTESVATRRNRGVEPLSLSHLNRKESLRETGGRQEDAPTLALHRSHSMLAEPRTTHEGARFEGLQLSSPAPSAAYTSQQREGGGARATIDFSNQLGALPRGDTRKRMGFDLMAEPAEAQGRKRPKSPQEDFRHERVEESVQPEELEPRPAVSHEPRPAGTGGATSVLQVDYGELSPETAVLCKARAKRGCATHPRSIAERVRRTRISENMRKLQDLVPNIDKQANTADMLDEAVEYMKFLATKVEEMTGGRADLEQEFAMRRGELNNAMYHSSNPAPGGGGPSRSEAESSDI